MELQRIGPTPLEGSRIVFGCMTLSEDTREAITAIQTALDQGINVFDHADIYGRGQREATFSAIWDALPGLRDKIVIQSKCGIRFRGTPDPSSPGRYDFSREHIVESVEGSLRRLKTDYLDILLLHRPDPLVEPAEVAEAFTTLKQSGKVRYFGVSNHSGPQIDLLRRTLPDPLIANQMELNLLHNHLVNAGVSVNQDNLTWPVRGEGTLEYCRLHDITLQAWSPLARGHLSGNLPANADDRTVRAAEAVAQMAAAKGVSREAIVLAWLLRHPARMQAVIGTTNRERIKACCQATEVQLSREEWYTLFIAGRGGPLP
ncbi:MAG: aldo/keto reductase [Anaerolineae bacterium]|nr:aldo/keto reductase [Anaerolineae bacterium]